MLEDFAQLADVRGMHVTRRVRRLSAAWLAGSLVVLAALAAIAVAIRLGERSELETLRNAARLPGEMQAAVGAIYTEAGMLVVLTGADASEVPAVFATYAGLPQQNDRSVNLQVLLDADARGASALEGIDALGGEVSDAARSVLAPLPEAVVTALEAGTLQVGAVSLDDYAAAGIELTYASTDAQQVAAGVLATVDPAPRDFATRVGAVAVLLGVVALTLGLMFRFLLRRTVEPVEVEALGLRRHNAQLQGLLRETRRLSTLRRDETAPDLPSLASQVAAAAAALVEADYAVVFLAEGNTVRAAGACGGAMPGVVRLGEGMIGAVVESGTPQRASLSFDPALPHEHAPVLVVLPLVAGASVTGALAAGSRTGRTFGEAEETLLRLLALSAATALENVRAYAASEELAVIDELTGLYNKRRLHADLARLASRARFEQRPLACAMLDVDHFKKYNDTHGHPAGDAALRRVAEVLRACVRAADLVYRYGGEEFTVLLPDTGLDEAGAVVERIRAGIEHAWFAGEESQPLGRVTASVGLASAPPGEPEGLVGLADTALYEAKASGRNRVMTRS